MKTIKVRLKEKSYNIIITHNNYANLGREIRKLDIGEDIFIITDKKVKRLLLDKITASLKREKLSFCIETISGSEKSKSIEVWSKLINKIVKFDKGRKLQLVALGGGVIGDLTGFIASVYKRGISYIQVPTTLLAQVDSAIGGKTAIDLPCGKNLIGTIYQPRLVYSDISALETLSTLEIRNGLAEVIKYGVIKNQQLFNYLERKEFNPLQYNWEYIISECSKIKAEIVEKDEYDRRGIRMILNFGHTIGHGIETASNYSKRYSHGGAISIGMLCAVELGILLNITSPDVLKRLENLIIKIGLPNKIHSLKIKDIMKAIVYDKKFQGGKTRMVFIKNIGKAFVKEGIPWYLIEKVIEKRLR